MPSAADHHLYVRVKLGDCAGNDDVFPTDDKGNSVGGTVRSVAAIGQLGLVSTVVRDWGWHCRRQVHAQPVGLAPLPIRDGVTAVAEAPSKRDLRALAANCP